MTPDPAATQLITDVAAANTADNFVAALSWILPASVAFAFILLVVWFFIRMLINGISSQTWS